MISLHQTINFKSPTHKKLLHLVRDRQKYSKQKMRDRYTAWREQDEAAVAYIKEKDVDRLRKSQKKNAGVIDYVTIEVPYSYGMMMTAHTYLTSVFLGRSPVQQFTARHGEGQQNVMAVEALMDYQFNVGEQSVPHFIWLHDALKYGVGIVGTYWEEEEIVHTQIVEKEQTIMGVPTGQKRKVKESRVMKGYQGNKIFNIRPYKFLPDPRLPLYRLQEGEFCGYETEISILELKDDAARGRYFNVEFINNSRDGASTESDEGDDAVGVTYPDRYGSNALDQTAKNMVKVTELCIKIVPKEYGLGQSERVEKWVFTMANDQVIIGAQPLGEAHGKFPYAVIEQEVDGYALLTRGLMEQAAPMNDVLTWLFNSHFYNVRSALNNQFIYDPSKVVSADILDKEPGKRIRLKPDAYGTDVRSVVSQIPVQDHTSGHFNDFNGVSRLMEQMFGINPNLMGLVNTGGRKTATEVRASSSSSANRLKTIAEYMSAMGHGRLAQMQLQSTQQHYDGEQKFRILGDIMSADPFMKVTPELIAGFYDFVPVDGTEPIDRFAQANLWKEIMAGLAQDQVLGSQFDRAGIFTWVAQLAGMRNIKQFRISAAPNPALGAQAQQGNMVPVQGSGLESLLSQPNMMEPGQIPGMGPTG